MAILKKKGDGNNYLKVKESEHIENLTKAKGKATVLSEFVMIEKEWDGQKKERFQGLVKIGKNEYMLDVSNVDDLIDDFGPDSEQWIGKTIKIKVDGDVNYRHFKVFALD